MKKVLTIAVILMIAALLLVACNKETGTTASVTTAAPGTNEPAVTTQTSDVTTAAPTTTAAVTTKKPAETFVSPDLSLVDFDTKIDTDIKVYSNPLRPTEDMGDPFCMRYDGKFYLYWSVGGDSPIKVRESVDLVNWTNASACVPTDQIPAGTNEHGGVNEICMGAYAPEVTYYNGKFYMVSSPGGMGHYVWVATNPMGPFERATENFGCKIDGDIFIDNDGKWYFYYANGAGIQCRPMNSPTEVSSTIINTGSIIDEGGGTWTEGSMIIYHDGIYYMTYTGNHVRHSAYRVEYGISYDGPTKFRHDPDSQVFVSTTNQANGIGHSSSVKGPDLDSYYLVYHTRGSGRNVNVDRIIFNGEEMTVMGPTVAQAAVPNMPDIYALFDESTDGGKFTGTFTIEGGAVKLGADAKVMAKDALARDQYTIEVTTKNIAKDAKAGVIFGYKDDNNFGSAMIDTKTEEMIITFAIGGKKTEHRVKLIRSFDIPYDFNAVQAIQVEKTGKTFTFYLNDRELAQYESELDGLGVGIKTEGGSASFGYFGATAATGGNATKDYYKPVASQTGYILATYCREWDIKTGVTDKKKETYLVAENGKTYNYSVYAEKQGSYGLTAHYRSENGATLSIFVDGVYVKDMKLAPSKDFSAATVRDLSMGYKGHVITVFVREGNADILYYRCMTDYDLTKPVGDDFENRLERGLSYTDGVKWSIKDGALTTSAICKRLWGSYMLGDYTVSVDADPSGLTFKYGLLVRTTNPGEPTFITSGNSFDSTAEGAQKGANWMQGYYVQFEKSAVSIYRIDYDKVLSTCLEKKIEYKLDADKHTLSVKCEGPTLTVYVDGAEIGSYTDPDPFTNGMAGLKNLANTGTVSFDNFWITPNE